MIVTFCGHANCCLSNEEKNLLKNTLTKIILENDKSVFYFGGAFKTFSYAKKKNIPYLNIST